MCKTDNVIIMNNVCVKMFSFFNLMIDILSKLSASEKLTFVKYSRTFSC